MGMERGALEHLVWRSVEWGWMGWSREVGKGVKQVMWGRERWSREVRAEGGKAGNVGWRRVE